MGLISKKMQAFADRNSNLSISFGKKVVVVATMSIIIISFSLFFYFQQHTEYGIRSSIFEQQEQIQNSTTKALTEHIAADLDSIRGRLHGLANSKNLQEGDFTSDSTKRLLEEYYKQITNITPVDRLFILDNNGSSKIGLSTKNQSSYDGINFSYSDWVEETENTLSPIFSDSFIGVDGRNKIAITYPIIIDNRGVKEYLGLVGVIIPTMELFKFYGNTYDIRSQYLAVLDSKTVQLVHPVSSFVGKPFFGDFTQNATGHNKALNNLIRTVVMDGQPSSAIYEFTNGERLNTGYPIILDGKPRFSVFVITPTSSIYAKINDIIDKERLQMFSLIACTMAAVTVLVIFLSRLNSILDMEVKKRTKALEESNKKLELANEHLKVNDNLQKEFINTAAHELRTPIQPILGLSQMFKTKATSKEQEVLFNVIIRNATRLKKLADDILDVTKIESNALKLNKEIFDMNSLIIDIVNELRDTLDINRKIRFDLHLPSNPLILNGDKGRIIQAVTNLISNSIKFIPNGEMGIISIYIEKTKASNNYHDSGYGGNKEVTVKIRDNGVGIDTELMPRLFTKFASKSFQGTGLGLFISKSIIEAHGGNMWADNNQDKDMKGATFSFSLPLKD